MFQKLPYRKEKHIFVELDNRANLGKCSRIKDLKNVLQVLFSEVIGF